ncbi:MAG: hypothetical protein H6712_27830 [Myxococcales bacterium]|nr:hypothetical protein [Myxococcales bacterium]MCB9717690.1 hypothetical protein [Myxococcales bacterium]
MERSFNTAGPCRASRHYMLPPLRRLPQVCRIIEREHYYFVIHAPRPRDPRSNRLGSTITVLRA